MKEPTLGGVILNQELKAAARQAAKAEMARGFLWFLGGAAVTGFTYLAADPEGTYFVFWGLLAYGAYRLLRATYYWVNPEALLRKV